MNGGLFGPDGRHINLGGKDDGPGEQQIKVGMVPAQGLVILQIGKGRALGVPWDHALSLAHNIIGKALSLMNQPPELECMEGDENPIGRE